MVICISSVPVNSWVETQIKHRQKIAHNLEGRGEGTELGGQRVRQYIFNAWSRHAAHFWSELSRITLSPSDLTFLRCSQQIPPPQCWLGRVTRRRCVCSVGFHYVCAVLVEPSKDCQQGGVLSSPGELLWVSTGNTGAAPREAWCWSMEPALRSGQDRWKGRRLPLARRTASQRRFLGTTKPRWQLWALDKVCGISWEGCFQTGWGKEHEVWQKYSLELLCRYFRSKWEIKFELCTIICSFCDPEHLAIKSWHESTV